MAKGDISNQNRETRGQTGTTPLVGNGASVSKFKPFALRQKGRDPLGGRGPQSVYPILAAVHKGIYLPASNISYHVEMSYGFWADVLGLIHAAIVLFVVGGQVLILTGWAFGWVWTRGLWLRRAHLGFIIVIMTIAALGEWCPLTVWESELRHLAEQQGYTQGFIATWLDRLLYYQAPLWVFAVAYILFTVLVVWTYWKYPPTKSHR